jgi:hypothetical protein
MADEGFKRKLTAILSADVEGYSCLMRDDEEATECEVRSMDFDSVYTVCINRNAQKREGS